MFKQTTLKDGSALFVEVGGKRNDKGELVAESFQFPEGFAVRKNETTGKELFQIPVTYTLMQPIVDESKTLGELVAAFKLVGIEDPIAEMNAGLKLAQGDLAKAPFKVKKVNALTLAVEAQRWLLLTAPRELISEYTAVPEAGRDAWLLAKYEESKATV